MRRDSERKFPVDFRAGRRAQIIHCACGATGENPIGQSPPGPDDVVAGHFRAKGWEVDSRLRTDRHRCPDCVALETARRRLKQGKPMSDSAKPANAQQPAPAIGALVPAAVAPRPHLAGAKVDATMLLGDQYDVAAKAYRAGYSDERVAKESGAPLEWVRARREADFGPLPPPKPKPATEALGKLLPIHNALKAHADQIDRLRGTLVNLIAENHRNVEAVGALSKFLGDLAAKETAP